PGAPAGRPTAPRRWRGEEGGAGSTAPARRGEVVAVPPAVAPPAARGSGAGAPSPARRTRSEPPLRRSSSGASAAPGRRRAFPGGRSGPDRSSVVLSGGDAQKATDRATRQTGAGVVSPP